MTLPASGAISLNDVNVELGLSGTTSINMNQATVRTLFGIASGAIAMSDGYGKSNEFAFTISSNTTNANLRTLALAAGWPGTAKVVATINSSIFVSSTSTGTPALTINGSFPGGVSLINNGTIQGQGGGGGNGGGAAQAGFAGSAGGLALSVTVAVTLTNNNRIAGGGGGGGGGGGAQFTSGKTEFNVGGCGGGGGLGGNGGSGGTGGFGNPPAKGENGSSGSQTTAGSGGVGGNGTAGGAGGSYGSAGSTGSTTTPGTPRAGGSGGAAGGCITGNSNITYLATGTRNGGIS